ncbi:glycine cleavage system aminomethyltransferase GcvT [Xanthobacter variabilis]|uniref:glycine cleavage system aminomethyltransferase GcvT n=1 Tax=Xanthobacter variabilis TaxID=3119932 RepID=UPI00374EEE09
MAGDEASHLPVKHLPLEDLHRQAEARFGAFAGWLMPLTYPAGVMKEHQHTRAHAGLFDISHMKLFELSGADAGALLDRACPLQAAALAPRHSKYSFLLNHEAGILDDVIVTRLDEARFMLVANAGNAVADEAHLRALAAPLDVTIAPLDRVFLALQGPDAEAVLGAAGVDAGALSFMQAVEPHPEWFLTRSGYTGEDGFEIALPEKDARALLSRLLADERVSWVGLAARDSLRLEAGLCLHGNDITPLTNPVDAALMWAIPKSVRADGAFVGAPALRDLLARGANEKRVGLRAEGRRPVRAGTVLRDSEGNAVGRVTSGGFGPSVDHPVAMGYVPLALSTPGTRLHADLQGKLIPMAIHPLPFTQHRYRKG